MKFDIVVGDYKLGMVEKVEMLLKLTVLLHQEDIMVEEIVEQIKTAINQIQKLVEAVAVLLISLLQNMAQVF